ncbi:MAG: hypothetical protein GY785_15375 [Gammaproteobacteria bacterium]|nr:hypothetical protein [Gammaproteobacteria bacterium]
MYEWASYLPSLYQALELVNGVDGNWLIITENVVEVHPAGQVDLSPRQPLISYNFKLDKPTKSITFKQV